MMRTKLALTKMYSVFMFTFSQHATAQNCVLTADFLTALKIKVYPAYITSLCTNLQTNLSESHYSILGHL